MAIGIKTLLKALAVAATWWISIAVYAVLFPVNLQNIQALFGGASIKIEELCSNSSKKCAYVRTESPLSIDSLPVETVWWTLRAAQRPNFGEFGVECDPGAVVNMAWSLTTLQVTAESGECRERGSKAQTELVQLINKR